MPARKAGSEQRADAYKHEHEAVLRPEAGTQAQFRRKKPPRTYRYDSSLSPALDWDGDNASRELGEWLIAQIEEATALGPPHRFAEGRRFGGVIVHGLDDAVRALKALSKPFLDWAGKAERLSFDVATLPLFVHERLSTKAILETLKSHERDRQMELQLFGDPRLSLAQQLEAYEHQGGWVNRLILGDSLVVMNSLVEYEGLGGQVQMIYIDPPYGVKFGSNFQPFVRRRDVKDGDDWSLTREPEMVKAYRDTWELGLHSYLTYLRDRLLVARGLLADSGSVFVQISDENLHHVRELMDEVFGTENFVSVISFKKTTGAGSPAIGTEVLASVNDYILWYARDRQQTKYKQLFEAKILGGPGSGQYTWLETPTGERRRATEQERLDPPDGYRLFRVSDMTSQTAGPTTIFDVEVGGRTFRPAKGGWKTNSSGMHKID